MTHTASPFNSSFDTLIGPSDLIAALPGILGFYPTESVIIVGFEEDPLEPGCLMVGPVMRADLTHAAHAAAALERAGSHGCEMFLAFIISRIPNSMLARQAIEDIEALELGGAPAIAACWHLSEIATGTPYTQLFGPDVEALPQGTVLIDGWSHGTVSSVVASPTMKPFLAHGSLPALNREEAFAYFEREEHDPVTRDDVAAWTKLAFRRAEALWRKVEKREAGPKQVVGDACALLRGPRPLPLIDMEAAPSLNDLLPEEDDIVLLATMLARPSLRDCVVATCLENAESAAGLLLAFARAFDGAIRANALTLWAMVAFQRGLSSWAIAALTTVQDEMPTHSMSAIVLQVLDHPQAREHLAEIIAACDAHCVAMLDT